jgi:hypothetical protein
LWHARAALTWLALIIPMAMVEGPACAFFFLEPQCVEGVRFDHRVVWRAARWLYQLKSDAL